MMTVHVCHKNYTQHIDPQRGSRSLAMFPGPLNYSLTRWSLPILVLSSDSEGVHREGTETSHIGLMRAALNIHCPGCLGYQSLHSDVVAGDKRYVVRWFHPLNVD